MTTESGPLFFAQKRGPHSTTNHSYGNIEASRVEALAGYSLSPADIARVMSMDEQMLVARHSAAIENGRIKANAKVAENLFHKATGEDRESVTAAIFWLKTRAR